MAAGSVIVRNACKGCVNGLVQCLNKTDALALLRRLCRAVVFLSMVSHHVRYVRQYIILHLRLGQMRIRSGNCRMAFRFDQEKHFSAASRQGSQQ